MPRTVSGCPAALPGRASGPWGVLVLNRGAAATMELHGLASGASSGMAGALGMGKPPTLAGWRLIREPPHPLCEDLPPKSWHCGTLRPAWIVITPPPLARTGRLWGPHGKARTVYWTWGDKLTRRPLDLRVYLQIDHPRAPQFSVAIVSYV